MASIISKVESINVLFVDQLPSNKVVNVCKAVRINDRDMIFETANDRLYTNSKSYGGRFCKPGDGSRWEGDLIRAFVLLGRATKEDEKEHMKFYAACQLEREKKYTLKYMKEEAEKYGFTLTKAQVKKLS